MTTVKTVHSKIKREADRPCSHATAKWPLNQQLLKSSILSGSLVICVIQSFCFCGFLCGPDPPEVGNWSIHLWLDHSGCIPIPCLNRGSGWYSSSLVLLLWSFPWCWTASYSVGRTCCALQSLQLSKAFKLPFSWLRKHYHKIVLYRVKTVQV